MRIPAHYDLQLTLKCGIGVARAFEGLLVNGGGLY